MRIVNRLMGFCLCLAPLVAYADVVPGPWSWDIPSLTPAALYAVAQAGAGGPYVAVGQGGVLMRSTDGSSWQSVRTLFADFPGSVTDAQNASDLSAVTWWNGHFYAGGADKLLLYSADGLTWSAATVTGASSGGFKIISFASSAALIVAGTTTGVVLVSSDGVNWQYALPSIGGQQFSLSGPVMYMGGAFYLVAENISSGNGVFKSTDGLHWSQVSSYPGASVNSGATSGSLLLVSDMGSHFYSTSDGVNWQTAGSVSLGAVPVTWTGKEFALLDAFDPGPAYYTSPDGVSWTLHSGPAPFAALLWTGTQYIGVGGGIYTSSDGVSWTGIGQPSNADFTAAMWDGTEFVLFGSGGKYSGDGSSWTATPLQGSPGALPKPIIKGDQVYLDTDLNGIIAVSPDGVTWTNTGLDRTIGYHQVAQCGSLAVALSNVPITMPTSNIYAATSTSSSGFLTWTEGVTNMSQPATSLVCGSGVFMALGQYGVPVQSTDGIHWNAVSGLPSPPVTCVGVVCSSPQMVAAAFLNGKFVLVDDGGGFDTSADTVTWTRVTPTSALMPTGASALIWDGQEYLVETTRGVMISDDLKTWYMQEYAADFMFAAFAGGGGHVLEAGDDGIIEAASGAGKPPTLPPVSVNVDGSGDASGQCGGTDPTGLTLTYAALTSSTQVLPDASSFTLNTQSGAFQVFGAVFPLSAPSMSFICMASNGTTVTANTVTILPEVIATIPPPPPTSGGKSGGGGEEGGIILAMLASALGLRRRGRRQV